MGDRNTQLQKMRKTKQSTYKRLNSKLRRGSAALMSGARRRSKGLKQTFSRTHIHSLPLPSEADDSEPPEEKITLYDRLYDRLFKGELTGKRYADVIRTAHCLRIESKGENGQKELFIPSEVVTSELIEDKVLREMTRMVLVIEKLTKHFAHMSKMEAGEEEEKRDIEELCERVVSHVYDFVERYKNGEIERKHFNLTRMFKELSNYFATDLIDKVRSVLKFVHISVISFAVQELREKLDLKVDHLTKDLHWEIKLGLSDKVVEVSHTRKESVLNQKGENNYWEIEYNLTLNFDPLMTKFFAVRLALKNLQLSESMDEELKLELNRKFFRGKFTVC